ncbi:uncharacterized protein LOC127809757 isoform X3 [Diospyros lotus]|uniref:uncharacterized protein LOC127809757 isoform X3 n=1 Tax=Diospyros lotus TaxID=55363 RepID=UPI002254E529|nr:uncharacterized protein LOC127809757 isoform X3 [Diospyros lotus]
MTMETSQEQGKKKMIGHARERPGLYYLETSQGSTQGERQSLNLCQFNHRIMSLVLILKVLRGFYNILKISYISLQQGMLQIWYPSSYRSLFVKTPLSRVDQSPQGKNPYLFGLYASFLLHLLMFLLPLCFLTLFSFLKCS